MSAAISVGNLAMGGRGKTPVVAHLARLLVAAGERPAILSRGYGRRHIVDGVVVVSDGEHLLADVDRAGDEPLMLARAVPGAAVLVCEQRALAGALATRAFGATVLILDDGFQHRAMPRDVDIVIIAASDLRARRFPLGPLRESVDALRRAHAILIDGELGAEDRESLPTPTFQIRRSTGAPIALEPARPAPAPGSRVVALSAIAGPERFTRGLESAGWQVVQSITHRDHHRFTGEDLAVAARAVRDHNAAGLLTTEKDAMRLLPLRPFAVPIAAVPLDVSIEPAAAFEEWLAGRMRGIRR